MAEGELRALNSDIGNLAGVLKRALQLNWARLNTLKFLTITIIKLRTLIGSPSWLVITSPHLNLTAHGFFE